jgi:lipopolysaccharide transport system ATP-binding protein
MSDTIIRVENLGKKYIIGHQKQERYLALRDAIANGAKSAGRKLLKPFGKKMPDSTSEEFWALKDVSFEIKRGDCVGIIGRNGAGKSTLLKILSRITEPTNGRISIKGRVASLLEVGTGFHPELTGRENIYLNGAILGMSKAEIKSKFDEIVAFAEVEQFLDTPVKRFSSGMYVRLAFAVAAHLEPEILIVDEVLAVGDAQFQEKCLGKMENVGKSGKTVLFVSHNVNAIERLCKSALLLEKGVVKTFSQDTQLVIKDYIFGQKKDSLSSEWINPTGNEFNNRWFKPTRFFISDAYGNACHMPLTNNSEMWIQLEGEIQELDSALTIGYAIYSEEGSLLYWSYQTDSSKEQWPIFRKGFCILRSKIPKRFLNEGIYKLELAGGLHFREWLFDPGNKSPCIYLTIQGGLSDSPLWIAKRPGILAPLILWETKMQ